MASGGTFLQQKVAIDRAPPPAVSLIPAHALGGDPQLGSADVDSDEEQDPNDVAPMTSAAPVTKAMARDPYEALEDEDYDEDVDGGSDSDSD